MCGGHLYVTQTHAHSFTPCSRRPLSQTAMCGYATGINQLAGQSVSELCLGYISWKDDCWFVSFKLILLDLWLVSRLFSALWHTGLYELRSNPESDVFFYDARLEGGGWGAFIYCTLRPLCTQRELFLFNVLLSASGLKCRLTHHVLKLSLFVL